MNQTARLPSQTRALHPGGVLSGLAAALLETAAFLTPRGTYAVAAPPPAYRQRVSKRAQRFMRGGE
jgi:hypothetical protein